MCTWSENILGKTASRTPFSALQRWAVLVPPTKIKVTWPLVRIGFNERAILRAFLSRSSSVWIMWSIWSRTPVSNPSVWGPSSYTLSVPPSSAIWKLSLSPLSPLSSLSSSGSSLSSSSKTTTRLTRSPEPPNRDSLIESHAPCAQLATRPIRCQTLCLTPIVAPCRPSNNRRSSSSSSSFWLTPRWIAIFRAIWSSLWAAAPICTSSPFLLVIFALVFNCSVSFNDSSKDWSICPTVRM